MCGPQVVGMVHPLLLVPQAVGSVQWFDASPASGWEFSNDYC